MKIPHGLRPVSAASMRLRDMRSGGTTISPAHAITAIAVGMPVAKHLPHRSVREGLLHMAPTSGNSPLELREAYLRTAPHPEDLPVFFAKSVQRMRDFKGWTSEEVQSIEAP